MLTFVNLLRGRGMLRNVKVCQGSSAGSMLRTGCHAYHTQDAFARMEQIAGPPIREGSSGLLLFALSGCSAALISPSGGLSLL